MSTPPRLLTNVRMILLTLVAASVLFTPATALTLPSERSRAAEILSQDDVFVSSQQLREASAPVADRLREHVAAMRRQKHDVKLAIVTSFEGQDPFAYARELRDAADYDGTLLVTTLTGPVGAAGLRDQRSIRAAFRAANVDLQGNAVDRLGLAAAVAVPPKTETSSNGWRSVATFVLLAVIGAAASIGWGVSREQRRNRRNADHQRGVLVLGLDIVEARIEAIDSPKGEGSARVASPLHKARRALKDGREVARLSGNAFDAPRGFQDLHEALEYTWEAANVAGKPFPRERPADGLCSADPAHGPSREVAVIADRSDRTPVCADCAERVRAGTPPRRRLLPSPNGPIAFDDVDLAGMQEMLREPR